MLRSQQSLNAISDATGLPNWTKVKTDASAYYFCLNLLRRDIRKQSLFEEIPISRLIKELVSIFCNYQHINILAYDKHARTLSFRKFLSEKKVNEINLNFIHRLSNLKNKSILINLLIKDWLTTYQQSVTQPTFKETPTLPEQTSNDTLFCIKKRKRPIPTCIPLLNAPNPSISSENYQWNSGAYSRNQAKSIVKLRERNNLFSLFQLKPEDFTHCPKGAYNHFRDIITTNARIVPKRNNQGIVYTRTPVKNQQGFIANYKAKALGKTYGDIRVYAEEEVDKQGHKLLIFNILKLRNY